MEEIKTVKLLVATGLYPPDIGGPATYSKMLEEKLHEHRVDVTIVAFGSVRHLPKLIRHVVFFWKLIVAGFGTDVVYALDSISVGVPAWLASVILGKPFVIRLGGDYAWEQGRQRFGLELNLDEYTSHKKSAKLPVRILAAVQGFVVRRARQVIAPSNYLKSIIETWGVQSSKIVVIYSALFPLEIKDGRESIRKQLAYTGTVISTVGRLVPWKGFLELIEVVSELKKEIPDVSLVIVGDGPQRDLLQQKIIDMQLTNDVRLVGRLGKDALGAAIKASDVFVLNTSYEGLSHQLLEVMDLGVPIVTTNVGGNPELIIDGVSGLMVEPRNNEVLAQAIKRLIKNTSLQTQLVQNAKVRTLVFSQDAVVAEFAQLLHTLHVGLKK